MADTRAEAHRQAWAERSGRRRLLLKAMGLGAAGLAAGGIAAWTKGEVDSAATTGVTLGDTRKQLEAANATRAALALSYAALQGQANDWQSQLAATASQNTQLAGAVNAAQQEANDLKAKLTAAQTALNSANERLARSSELISLYNQLDGVGLDNVVATGLGVLGGAMANLGGPVGLLHDGLDAAHGLLAGFERTLPDFNGAMAWLGQQVVNIRVALKGVELTAQQAANSTLSGVTAVFGGFVGFVLDPLPFNIGANVRNTLNEVQRLLEGVTAMADQAPEQVLLKISQYVGDGPQGWQQALINPLRLNTLTPAGDVLAGVAGASDAFTTSLHQPATAALQQRQALHEQIASFRAAHGL